MPYHVEVRRPRRHARLFNLSEAQLRHRVVEPWLRGAELTIGDRRWVRRETALRILHGPELSAADLAYGQGWNAAERTARDVTAELLREPGSAVVAVLAPDEATLGAIAGTLRAVGATVRGWPEVRERLLAWLAEPVPDAALGVGAVVVACAQDAPAEWLLDVGLALGALGPRAVLAAAPDGELPEPLRALAGLAVAPAPGPLAERLRRVGCALPAG
jgi:hypothetical protein